MRLTLLALDEVRRTLVSRRGALSVLAFALLWAVVLVYLVRPAGALDAGSAAGAAGGAGALARAAAERFEARKTDPLKQWKLSPIDQASIAKWDEYTEAKRSMFFYTDTADAPWTIVKSDDKKRARVNCMRHFLSSVDYPDKDEDAVGEPDPLIVGSAAAVPTPSPRAVGA